MTTTKQLLDFVDRYVALETQRREAVVNLFRLLDAAAAEGISASTVRSLANYRLSERAVQEADLK
jgi:hypothetical protein